MFFNNPSPVTPFFIDTWGLVKIPVLILLGLYSIFAMVVVRQVYLMTRTLDIGFELPIKVVAYLHLTFSILLVVFAFVVL
jgi:hypothetical protein